LSARRRIERKRGAVGCMLVVSCCIPGTSWVIARRRWYSVVATAFAEVFGDGDGKMKG
jgi:hypothetical protein